MYAKKRLETGFTLIELMIVVAIVAILAAIALPSYRQYIMRVHRTAAQSEMMSLSNRQEQYLLSNRTYADKPTLEAGGYALPREVNEYYDYSIAVGTGTVPSYTITFTPKGSQASDGDLTLNNAGVKTPAEKWK